VAYSQKYCLVHFINPVDTGYEFDMSVWPLHTTIADVFAIDRQENDLDKKLTTLLQNHPSVTTNAIEDSILGITPVVLLDKIAELVNLHNDIVSVVEESSAIFNTPEFTRDGFIPHSTVQNNERLEIGDHVTINSISLVDMFVGGDWQRRKVLATFNMQHPSSDLA
jgi:hypothetical protein